MSGSILCVHDAGGKNNGGEFESLESEHRKRSPTIEYVLTIDSTYYVPINPDNSSTIKSSMLRTWSRQPRNALVSFSSRSGFVRSRIAYSSPSHNKLVANKQFHSDSHNAPPPFSYHLAVSASGKKSGLTSVKSGVNLWTQKHVEGQEPVLTSVEANSGQDAFFMAQVGRSRRHVVLSVVDGVGGWEQSGVNPAAFAHGLTRYMADATLRPDTEAGLRPIKLLQKGYDKVQKDKTILAGGSTACVATADSSGYLEVAK